jgi:formylglycine-generating enzyme required for sulfatase activity
MYRDMPGGLIGIRNIVKKCHAQNVKVFIDYNPWDIGTRREPKSDFEMLAEMVLAIDADGIFLDTLSAGDPNLRLTMDAVKPGVAMVSEGHPSLEQLSICSGSWGQWLEQPDTPALLKLRWIEPRHMQYQIRRWDIYRQDEISAAFFNASGLLVWENVFGTYNPWTLKDRLVWNKANRILNQFSAIFVSSLRQPCCDVNAKDVYVNGWQKNGMNLYILAGLEKQNTSLELPYMEDRLFYDVWRGTQINPEIHNGTAKIQININRLGCIAALDKTKIDKPFEQFLQKMRELTEAEKASADLRNFSNSLLHPDSVARTRLINKDHCPEGMVFIPSTTFSFEIEHIRGECGCYPDPEVADTENFFGYGLKAGAVYPKIIHETIKHKIGPVAIKSFIIDETEVTNAQYQKFLIDSGYKPAHKENFLKHWPDGKMPEELADHPVVYVDIDDARAYAKWAGKRLPTEEEWQLAAQGTDGRKWPWGNDFDPNKCNSNGISTVPAKSLPQGKSPYGCYHMSGNVWEWTESCRSDGHTRFTMLRSGSYYNAEGSIWYVSGGPKPCGSHVKFVRMWPGLDRCATVGFRCVADAH